MKNKKKEKEPDVLQNLRDYIGKDMLRLIHKMGVYPDAYDDGKSS